MPAEGVGRGTDELGMPGGREPPAPCPQRRRAEVLGVAGVDESGVA